MKAKEKEFTTGVQVRTPQALYVKVQRRMLEEWGSTNLTKLVNDFFERYAAGEESDSASPTAEDSTVQPLQPVKNRIDFSRTDETQAALEGSTEISEACAVLTTALEELPDITRPVVKLLAMAIAAKEPKKRPLYAKPTAETQRRIAAAKRDDGDKERAG